MEIKPIKTDADCRLALKEIETLMSVADNTLDGEKMNVLVSLVEAYERKNYPLDLPSPVEAIKFEMDRRGLAVKDIEPMIGKSN